MSKKELPIDLMMKTVNWEAVTTNPENPEDGLPSVTHEGTLKIEGITIRCYKLDNGKSIFNAEDIEAMFAGLVG